MSNCPGHQTEGARLHHVTAFNAGPCASSRLKTSPKTRMKCSREVSAVLSDGKRLLGLLTSGQPERLQGRLDLGAITAVPLRWADAAHRNPTKWALSPDGAAFRHVQDRPGEQSGNGPSADVWRVLRRWNAPKSPLAVAFITCNGDVAGRSPGGGRPWGRLQRYLASPLAPETALAHLSQADEDWPSVSADGRRLPHTEN
jgi:hypothetical protein